jgi:uncharacterized protein (DUF2461 family)
MASDQIARYRRGVDNDVAAGGLLTAISTALKAKLELGGEQLTRVPTGFAKDHPRADLLRRKSLTLHRDLGFPAWLATARTKTEIIKAWRAMQPLIDWLDTNIGAPVLHT